MSRTTCGYGTPCPGGVAIPETFAAYNSGSRFEGWNEAHRALMAASWRDIACIRAGVAG